RRPGRIGRADSRAAAAIRRTRAASPRRCRWRPPPRRWAARARRRQPRRPNRCLRRGSTVRFAPTPAGVVAQPFLEPAVDGIAVQALSHERAPRSAEVRSAALPRNAVLAQDPAAFPLMDAERQVRRQPERFAMIAIEIEALADGSEAGAVLG